MDPQARIRELEVALERTAANCTCFGTGVLTVPDFETPCEPHPTMGPLPRSKKIACWRCAEARRVLGLMTSEIGK